MASVAPPSLTLSYASSSTSSFHHQQDFTFHPSLQTHKPLFLNSSFYPVTLNQRERNCLKWVDVNSQKQQPKFGSFNVVVAAVAAEAAVAETEEEEEEAETGGGVATLPPSKPKKGKAALPLKRDRVSYFSHFFF